MTGKICWSSLTTPVNQIYTVAESEDFWIGFEHFLKTTGRSLGSQCSEPLVVIHSWKVSQMWLRMFAYPFHQFTCFLFGENDATPGQDIQHYKLGRCFLSDSPQLLVDELMMWNMIEVPKWRVQPGRDNSFPGKFEHWQYKEIFKSRVHWLAISNCSKNTKCCNRHLQKASPSGPDNLDNSEVRREARLKLTFHASNKWWSWWSMRVVRFSKKKYDSQL